MRIHGAQADEIYIVLFIQYKKKNPDLKTYEPWGSWRSQGFPGGDHFLYFKQIEESRH